MQPGYYTALFYSVVLHGLLLGFLAASFGWQQFTAASESPPLAIQAAVVDESLIAAELEKLQAADEAIRAAEVQR
ncbi:MAG: cell envelope integrity protein TolA, partial [Gammaproteobacteria bacterium]|nr:cell envelope integrity protein TolA [Gammaproteobacteria bacterium]